MLHGQYATRRDEALYPQLWDKLLLSYVPAITGPTGTRVFDFGPSAIRGTLTNMDAATDWPVACGVRALDFDGSNDFVVSAAGFPKLSGNSAVSISTWLKFAVTGSGGWRCCAGLVRSEDGFAIFQNPNSIANTVSIGIYGAVVLYSPATITTGVWYHVAATKSPGDFFATTKLFVNGTPVTTTTFGTSRTPNFTTTDLWIGGDPYNEWSTAGLQVAEVSAWNRELTPAEVRRLAQSPGVIQRPKRRRVFAAAVASNRLLNLRRRAVTC